MTAKALLAAVALTYGCSNTETGNPYAHPVMFSPGGAGSAGGAGGAGSAGAPATTGGYAGTTDGSAGASVNGGATAVEITQVWQSDGCGKPYEGPTGDNPGSIDTAGTKDEVCNDKLMDGTPRCGAWGTPSSTWRPEPLPRDYYVLLPSSYDSNRAYPIVFMGPGCGGNGSQIYSLNDGTAPSAGNNVIRVGITPAASAIIGHACCPYGCFDDQEGNDSVDWAMYEALYDKLNQELCFDRNRVFASGHRSGATFANELACKYAGDASRPVRAPLSNSGVLPGSAAEAPTCTSAPMAGMWVYATNDLLGVSTAAFNVSVNRAMSLSGCAVSDYGAAAKENFPIGGGIAADICQRILGCDPLYPLVVCSAAGDGRGSHDEIVNPGFSTFVKLLSSAPLIKE